MLRDAKICYIVRGLKGFSVGNIHRANDLKHEKWLPVVYDSLDSIVS